MSLRAAKQTIDRTIDDLFRMAQELEERRSLLDNEEENLRKQKKQRKQKLQNLNRKIKKLESAVPAKKPMPAAAGLPVKKRRMAQEVSLIDNKSKPTGVRYCFDTKKWRA